MVWVYLQFTGGLEALFDNVKSHKVKIPTKNPDKTTVKWVVNYVRTKMLTKQPEMFIKDNKLYVWVPFALGFGRLIHWTN